MFLTLMFTDAKDEKGGTQDPNERGDKPNGGRGGMVRVEGAWYLYAPLLSQSSLDRLGSRCG